MRSVWLNLTAYDSVPLAATHTKDGSWHEHAQRIRKGPRQTLPRPPRSLHCKRQAAVRPSDCGARRVQPIRAGLRLKSIPCEGDMTRISAWMQQVARACADFFLSLQPSAEAAYLALHQIELLLAATLILLGVVGRCLSPWTFVITALVIGGWLVQSQH